MTLRNFVLIPILIAGTLLSACVMPEKEMNFCHEDIVIATAPLYRNAFIDIRVGTKIYFADGTSLEVWEAIEFQLGQIYTICVKKSTGERRWNIISINSTSLVEAT